MVVRRRQELPPQAPYGLGSPLSGPCGFRFDGRDWFKRRRRRGAWGGHRLIRWLCDLRDGHGFSADLRRGGLRDDVGFRCCGLLVPRRPPPLLVSLPLR